MLFLFIGFFFLFLDFPIAIGTATLNLMPAFVGAALLLVGFGRIESGESRFLRMRLGAALLGALDLALTLLAVLSVDMGDVLSIVTDALGILLSLYLAYETVQHVKALERKHTRPLGGNDLTSSWFLLALGNLLSLFVVYMDSMALLCIALQLLSVAWYQLALYRAWHKIEPLKK